VTRISQEDRLGFLLAQGKHREALAALRIATQDVEMERLRLVVKYGLGDGDTVDMRTGEIARPVAPDAEPAALPPTPVAIHAEPDIGPPSPRPVVLVCADEACGH
jgi:hypothetical protein